MITRRDTLKLLAAASGSCLPLPGFAQQLGDTSLQSFVSKDNFHYPLRDIPPDGWAFFNSDHSPIGAGASFVYGAEASGGVMMLSGRTRSDKKPVIVHDGILIAVRDGDSKAAVMPFCKAIQSPEKASLIDTATVHRKLRPSVDQWEIGHGVSWHHYTPYWELPDLAKSSPSDAARFTLPATWIEFQVDNRTGTAPKSVLFSLLGADPGAPQQWDQHHGYRIASSAAVNGGGRLGEKQLHNVHAVATPGAQSRLLTPQHVLESYGVAGANAAIEFVTPPGQSRTFVLSIAHFNGDEILNVGHGKLYLTRHFLTLDEVVHAATRSFPEAKKHATAYAQQIAATGINESRQFLFGHALASYAFNTALYLLDDGTIRWAVIEGEFGYINTFDLTIDHIFFELKMHPWTVKNELDLFASTYHFTDQLRLPPPGSELHPGGIGFCHDMGFGINYLPAGQQGYGNPMTQEELQNWILCAGLYWHNTQDSAWIVSQRATIEQCLDSMLLRDDLEPEKRDGVTSYVSVKFAPGKGAPYDEITTYDSLDQSLKFPAGSIYIAMKSFACYLAMESIFLQLGDNARVKTCQTQVDRVSASINARFDERTQSFPARFEGSSDARIVPTVEALVYPLFSGRKDALSLEGKNGQLIRNLRKHMQSILVPGICLDAGSGAWKLSSTSPSSWHSKIFIAQFVCEHILGITGPALAPSVDATHSKFHMLATPMAAFTDYHDTATGVGTALRHYPRGVTSVLWTEPPASPLAPNPPV